ncbi:hypothetical protein [Kineosporia sp. R_H_3]|uniref:hypothetical protein n=1 Tax=Kineosporia sp. R_H_3 TaxID=1961848 RepID=UPI000B4B73F2|nr:hypothetical protein [Kineosporia sp. R_H_3]
MRAPRTLRWTSAMLAVASAAVVTGAFAAWLQGLDDGVVAAVDRPRAVAPRPPAAVAQPRPAATRAVVTRVDTGAAGAVLLTVSGGSLVVRGVEPGPGWTVERARAGGRVDVRLRNGRAETRVEASLVGGEVVPRVRTKS